MADAMTEIFALFKRCNKYIDETMPWALAKDESKKDRLAEVLYNLVEGIASVLPCWNPSCLRQQRRSCPSSCGQENFQDGYFRVLSFRQ